MKTRLLLWVVILVPAFVGCAGCKSSKTLAVVGGKRITEGDLEFLARVNPRLEAQLKSPGGKRRVLDNYVDQLMMYLESKRRGLDNKREVQDKIKLYEKIIIAQATLEDELDKQSKEYYDSRRDEFERVKLSHILIRTAAAKPEGKKAAQKKKEPAVKRSDAEALKLAETVKERLTKGEAFNEVTKQLSEDERTNKTGGSLGDVTIRDKRFERWEWLPLAEKAFAMKEGEISEPIKTKDGYHILRVDKGKELRSFEEAKGMIRFRIQEETQGKLLADLRKKYKPTYTEDEKAAAAAAQPASPETKPAEAAPQAAPAPAAPESMPANP